MCNRYPDCQHSGPLVDKIDGIDRHCETVLPNHDCPYLRMGCMGCTFKHYSAAIETAYKRRQAFIGVAGVVLQRSQLPIDWATEHHKMQSMSINVQAEVDHTALLALLAGSFRAYGILQGLVGAGIVSKDWADQSLVNLIQYTQRQAICRIIAAYTDKRITAAIFDEITGIFGLPESFFSDDQGATRNE